MRVRISYRIRSLDKERQSKQTLTHKIINVGRAKVVRKRGGVGSFYLKNRHI